MKTFNFSTEFNALSRYLRAFAYKLTNDYHLSEDLFQDTAVLAFRYQNKFTPGSNLRAWLTTIMKNTFFNDFRKKQRKGAIQLSHEANYLFDSNKKNATNNDGESNLVMEELYEIVETLNENVKQPFLMYYLGHKYSEISDRMELPLGTIKSRIFIARKELKERIKAKYNINHSSELLSA